ncbi:DNA-directed RNA polymerase III subunit RPC3 [Lachancea thermotolerans]
MATNSASPESLDDKEVINGSVASLEARGLNPESFLYRELCKTHLGERAAAVMNMLVSKGRLSARELCDRLDMDLKSVKRILVSLVQLRCVQYCAETSVSGRTTVYYSYCEDGLLLMLYAGEIVEAMQVHFQSDLAAQIVQNVLALGSLTLKAYLSSGLSEVSPSEVSAYFLRLFEAGFLVPLTANDYCPVSELWTRLYKKEYDLIPKNSTLSDLKKRTEAKQKAKKQFYQLVAPPDASSFIVTDPRTSLRQVADSVPLTFSLGRYLKLKRSKQLVQFSAAKVGKVPAALYKIALRMTERSSPEITDPLTKTGLLQDADELAAIQDEAARAEEKNPGVTFNAMDISKHLSDDIDLRGTIASQMKRQRPSSAEVQSHKRVKTEDGFVVPPPPANNGAEADEMADDNIDLDLDDSDTDPHSVTLINGHLKLLASSTVSFLQEPQPGLYYVPYTRLMPLLKSSVYEALLSYTLGGSACRILRCIRDNNLATEKLINSTALMREKDIRSVIATLIRYNAVEIQEVPRTADRAASRSVFLFRNNPRHAYDFMTKNLTWNIANLYHKIEDLKSENSTLLQKANREDVKGKETELLLPSELNQLKMVNERELNALTRTQRLLLLWEVFRFF